MFEVFTIFAGIISFFTIVFNFQEKSKKYIFWIFLFLLIFFDGLRWETGTDWNSHLYAFNTILDSKPLSMEVGFTFYMWCVRSLTENYSIFLLLTSSIFYIGIFYQIFKKSGYSFIPIFYLTGTLTWYSGSMRQMIAIVFFIKALEFVEKKNHFKFFIAIFSGALFHSSVLPFAFIFWLYGAPFFLLICLFVGMIIFSLIISLMISEIDIVLNAFNPGTSMSNRIGGTLEDSSPILGFPRKILTILITYFLKTKLLFKNRSRIFKFNIIINFYFNLTLFSLIFYLIGTYFVNYVSSRLDIYTGIICMSILLGFMELNAPNKKFKLILFSFVLFLLIIFYSRLTMGDLFYPYKSIFYNTDFSRELY
jgi:hypothetical protein